MDKLTPERLAEITKEAATVFSNGSGDSHYDYLQELRREGYITAAVPRELLLEQERDKAIEALEAMLKAHSHIGGVGRNEKAAARELATNLINQYKSI